MALVVYVGQSDAVQLLDGTECRNGVPVEVSDDLAAGLLRQSTWRKAAPAASPTTPKPPKAAPAADTEE